MLITNCKRSIILFVVLVCAANGMAQPPVKPNPVESIITFPEGRYATKFALEVWVGENVTKVPSYSSGEAYTIPSQSGHDARELVYRLLNQQGWDVEAIGDDALLVRAVFVDQKTVPFHKINAKFVNDQAANSEYTVPFIATNEKKKK